jgi:hypothetical protein
MEEESSHNPEDLLQIPGRQYHIHKSDLKNGMIPIEVDLFSSLLSILEIDPIRLSEEKYLLCCEEINNVMKQLINIDYFSQNED